MRALFIETDALCADLPAAIEARVLVRLRTAASRSNGGHCKQLSRNGKDLHDRFREITEVRRHLSGHIVIDGEIIAVDPEGGTVI